MENETSTDNSVPEEDCNNWDDYVILSCRSMELIRAAQAQAAVASCINTQVGQEHQHDDSADGYV